MNAAGERPEFSTTQAWFRATLIVGYFVVATVIIPSRVLESSFLAEGPSSVSTDTWDIIRSLIGSGVWLVAVALGVWGLRRLQQRNVI